MFVENNTSLIYYIKEGKRKKTVAKNLFYKVMITNILSWKLTHLGEYKWNFHNHKIGKL